MTLRPVAYGEDVAGVVDRLVAWLAAQPITAWATFEVVEFSANVALFVPFGVLAVLWMPSPRYWAVAAVAGLGLSAAIETIQLLWLPERVADPRDLLSNTLGALVGAACTALVRRRSGRRDVVVA